jgi:hypothetical protein
MSRRGWTLPSGVKLVDIFYVPGHGTAQLAAAAGAGLGLPNVVKSVYRAAMGVYVHALVEPTRPALRRSGQVRPFVRG